MNADVISAAWGPHRQRFSEAMRQARSEIGPGGSFAAVSRRAWAIDPNLREQFGDAVGRGLRQMWSDAVKRAEQSERIRKTYTQSLRRRRSEKLKENWANANFRERMLLARRCGQAGRAD
jgi:hypothetical protein